MYVRIKFQLFCSPCKVDPELIRSPVTGQFTVKQNERKKKNLCCRYLKTFYRELGTRDPPHLPSWVAPLPLGTLCPAHFQPHLQLIHKSEQEHRLENIKIDQIFAPVRVSGLIIFDNYTVRT